MAPLLDVLFALLVEAGHRVHETSMQTVHRVEDAIGKPPTPLRSEWGNTAEDMAAWGAPAQLRDPARQRVRH